MRFNFVKKLVIHMSLLGTLLFSQNCTEGFHVQNNEALESLNNSDLPSVCSPGSTESGYIMSTALQPQLCGSLITKNCINGQWDRTEQLVPTCQQLCRHPITNEAASPGITYVSYSVAQATTQELCNAARIQSTCSQATGLFSPAPGQHPACLVQGQVCAYANGPGLSMPTGNMTGATVAGYTVQSATSPTLCGNQVTRTCQATGLWSGSTPLYTTCEQRCLHPDSNQPVTQNTVYNYFTRQNGTQAECNAARVTSTCQSNTGLFNPVVSQTRFQSCAIIVTPPPPPPSTDSWTNLNSLINSPAYFGSRVVYVSSSQGNDSTGQIYRPDSAQLGGNPLEPVGTIAPYSSLQAAWAQVRNGSADVMLLRRGDTWSTNLYTNKAGASASARIIVAAYGNPTLDRPRVGYLFPDSSSSAGNQLLAHYVSVFPSNAEVATRGFTTRFEGVLFTGPATTTVSPVLVFSLSGGMDVYRCGYSRVRLFSSREIGRGNMRFWDNVMWHPANYVGGGGFEHNNYFQFNVGDIDSRRNISAQSPGVGFRQRGLGTVEANLVLGGRIATFDIGTSAYDASSDITDRGTFLNMRFNLALHNPGAYALYDIKNAIIEQNIFLEDQYLTYYQNTAADGNPLPLTNATLQDNIFYGSYIVPVAGHGGSITGPYLIRRNDFQLPNGGTIIRAQSNDFTYENNNRFWSSSPQNDWFAGYTSNFAAYVPSRGSNTRVTYPDPNRNLMTYMQTLGVSPASAEQAIEWFIHGVPGQPTLRGAMNNRWGAWDERFTSIAVINYVRAGFGLSALGN